MATLGGREIRKRKSPSELNEGPNIASPNVNLIANPGSVQPVSTVDVPPSSLGSPIMREDFITKTGFLFRSPLT